MSPFARLASFFSGRRLVARGSLTTPSNTITTVHTLALTASSQPRCFRYVARGQADSANQAHYQELKFAVRRIGENATSIVQTSAVSETTIRDGSVTLSVSISTNDLLFRITGTSGVELAHEWRIEEEVW